MPYDIIDTVANNYRIFSGNPFSEFNAGDAFKTIFSDHFPQILIDFREVSSRQGNGNRQESLFEMFFQRYPESKFYAYAFQTESGGRGPDEARIQWRSHSNWNPDLSTLKKAKIFVSEINKEDCDLSNKECYIFSIYKRDLLDKDIIISAIYPTQAQDTEVTGTSPKSIQFKYEHLRNAFLKGISSSEKTNSERIIHFQPQFLIWYMLHRDQLHTQSLEEFNNIVNSLTATPSASRSTIDDPRNKIIYGAPGTGKSYELRAQARQLGFNDQNILRVTFHPSYSYQQFVGSYKPIPIYKSQGTGSGSLFKSDRTTALADPFDKEPIIDYAFVEGPFIAQLAAALHAPDQNYMLIIEEINRANVASVFGDTFQLLDRKTSGESEYEITFNPEVTDFLVSRGLSGKNVKIPANLFIWATMNSADQGVLPLDAAFKRRWSFEYLPLDDKEGVVADNIISFQGKRYAWNAFRRAINDHLKSVPVSEDKLLGPFFMNNQELADENAIKNKLLLYLRDDVLRHNPGSLFQKSTFSDIIKGYNAGEEIFNDFNFPTLSIPEPDEAGEAAPVD